MLGQKSTRLSLLAGPTESKAFWAWPVLIYSAARALAWGRRWFFIGKNVSVTTLGLAEVSIKLARNWPII